MKISPAQLDYFSELVSQNPLQALQELQENEAAYADDPTFWFNYGGFLIDSGVLLRQADVVERGIKTLQAMVPEDPDRALPDLYYNLANGYMALYDIAKHQPDFHYSPDSEFLLLAKQWFRTALSAHPDRLAARTRSMARVNYGNCLAQLGRTVEAIDVYDLALQDLPNHAMALGNLGIELNRYAYVARDPFLLVNARDVLREALADSKLEETGLANARPAFERSLAKIEERLAAFSNIFAHTHDQSSPGTHPGQPVTYLDRYVAFCRMHHLFLNFCLRRRPCAHPLRDTVGFSLTTDLDDDTTFYRLSRIVNEIKERYATARLLLFEACDPPAAAEQIDELTQYTDNLDYAVYGVRVAKLKLAFEGAYNVLDKIAFFINDYADLRVKEKQVSFASIWRERNGATIRPSLLKPNNWYLFGLYDISRDLAAGAYSNYLSELRNYSTHRYLVPHVEGFGWRMEADAEEYHIGYHELLEKTIELMRFVRSAVIYLIAFIDNEERRKRQNRPGLAVPMFVPLAKPYPIGPQDSGL